MEGATTQDKERMLRAEEEHENTTDMIDGMLGTNCKVIRPEERLRDR